MRNVIVVVFAAILLAACASQKSKTEASMGAAPGASSEQASDENSPNAKRSTYYGFDAAEVQPADRPLLEAHAKYLGEHPGQLVRLEGNCDERGSAEYNLGLGQRRADGVKKVLVASGAHADQISAVSFGKEKPRLTCHDESCWKEDRRTDLIYVK